MDFTFTEEQQMLLETTRRFIAKDYGFDLRRRIKESNAGYSPDVWRGFADLGLLALNVPEADGGLGGGPIETMLVMNAMGEGLVLEPFLASAVIATRTVAALGDDAQRAELLPAMAAGELIAVLAHDEPGTRFDRMAIATHAVPHADGYRLQGHKCTVAHASSAGKLLVTARLSGAAASGSLAIFAVAPETAGIRLLPYASVDGVRSAEVWLDDVFVPAGARLGVDADCSGPLGEILDGALAAVCAEAVGALDKLLAATVEYARTRKQFGVPIGRFQALQHRMADMLMHLEQARSMSYLAAVRCQERDPELRARALSAAKVTIGQACRFVGQQAVQLHGGMGVTDELDVSHYFKRLMAIELQFGSTDFHLESYAAQLS